jgi:hypothetical protein
MTGTVRKPILGPFPEAPKVSLLTVGNVVTERDNRWENGAEMLAELCGNQDGRFDLCAVTNKTMGTGGVREAIDPVGIYAAAACKSTFGFELADYVARAKRRLLAIQAWHVENEFWTGSTIETNPHLADEDTTDVTPGPGTALTPSVALGLLEEAMASTIKTRGIIHCTLLGFNLLAARQLIHQPPGQQLPMTWAGNLVVPGGGYTGSDPAGATHAGASEYIYATGMVDIRLGEIQQRPDNFRDATDRATNSVIFVAERSAMVTVDTCSILGIKVNVTA